MVTPAPASLPFDFDRVSDCRSLSFSFLLLFGGELPVAFGVDLTRAARPGLVCVSTSVSACSIATVDSVRSCTGASGSAEEEPLEADADKAGIGGIAPEDAAETAAAPVDRD